MQLFEASKQWSTRPADQRFESLQSLKAATRAHRETSGEKSVPWADLRVEAEDGEVLLSRAGQAKLTHWAFGQLCARLGAPAGYLRALPATLAAQNLNHGLAHNRPEGQANVLMHSNGSLVTRAITSDRYSRIWNDEVADRLLQLPPSWRVPPARPALPDQPGARVATAADCIEGSFIKPGEMIAPAGLYASDHDLFAFLIDTERRIEDGSEGGCFRGVFVENSEVGASSFKLTAFLLRAVCGNHIVWGAKGVSSVSIRHVGSADRRFGRELMATFQRYADESASDVEAKIAEAKALRLGDTKEAVLDAVFRRIDGLSRAVLEDGYDATDRAVDGDPRTAWGLVQGLTRVSQETDFADERARIDRAAARILAF